MSDFNDMHQQCGGDAVCNLIESATAPDLWSEPDMRLAEGYRHPAPSFPASIFGDFWLSWLAQTAESKGAPIDYTAAGLLSCASVLLGNSCTVSPWQGWIEPPILWLCCLGLPSSSKTPAINAATDLLRDLEGRINPTFDSDMMEYERQLEQAKAAKKSWIRKVEDADKKGDSAPPMPALATEPEKPVKKRLIVNDATVEIIAPILSKNPKGVLLFRDELVGWLNGLNQYKGGNGSDRAFYLEAYNGKPYTVDRVKWGLDGSLTVPHLSIPIVGGIQPDRFVQAVLSDADDGMAARFLYFFPISIPPQKPRYQPDNQKALAAFEKLNGITLRRDEHGVEHPTVIPLDPKAADLLQKFRMDVHQAEKSSSGHYLSYIGKNGGRALRLSLLIELLRWSATDDPVMPEIVSVQSMLSALTLITDYLDPMARRSFDDAALPEETRSAMTLAKWIIRTRAKTINSRDIQRSRLAGLDKADKISKAIEELIESGWLHSAPDNDSTNGRPRRDYLVNPKIWNKV